MNIYKQEFGNTREGKAVEIFSLKNDNGMEVKITNYGGIITQLWVPDKFGEKRDVILGFDNLEDYLDEHPYFGAIIGRYANRIEKGTFTLNQKKYILAKNNGKNHLHGGVVGFDKKIWTAHKEVSTDNCSLFLACEAKDMEEGYPGNMMIEVIYSLNNRNELIIDYKARTDKDTVLNLTNHSYFNLKGGKSDVLSHSLKLNCAYYTPVNEDSIPTGEILSVENTPFDFRSGKKVSEDWNRMENGYDHNFVISGIPGDLNEFADLKEDESGIRMEVATTEPGVQLYTANYIESIQGKRGMVYKKNAGICLETQHFPDSPNKVHFPSVILTAGQEYTQKTVFRFSNIN